MQNYQTTDVYEYLNNLYIYLTGDLKEFRNLCSETEKKENNISYTMTASNSAGFFGRSTSSLSASRNFTEEIKHNSKNIENIYLLEDPYKTERFFRLTIPITLSLFAVIDCLGFLAGSNDDSRKTNKNFREFFKKSPIFVKESECDFINQVFRQGLSHVYFPKLNLGVSYHSKNPKERLIFKTDRSFLVLNVNRLEEIVLNTFDVIKGDILLYSQMETRYKSLVELYTRENGKTIADYAS